MGLGILRESTLTILTPGNWKSPICLHTHAYTAMFDYQIALGTYGPWIAMAPGSARFQVSEQACAMLRDGILSSAPSERRACLVREAVSLWHQR